jgi:alanyl-tRNA synthetase
MKSHEIRQAFLDYFKKNGHRLVPSSPVVPLDDPTLLFTNAGMVQFKNTFLGLEKRDYKRAASSQKCIRAGGKHNDLDNVGFTARHQTFFEMLGNFSFGDYFKEEAIYFAWEFVTKTLGLNPKRLTATVFTEDNDAERLWKKIAPELGNRVLRFGEKDNYWAMGETGPCGPCSEIHYDRGEKIPGELNGEGDRFVEIWNLVFMQFNRDENGKITPLPKPSVDTGAGLERFSMVIQNADSNYATDLFKPLIEKVVELSGKRYDSGAGGVPHRVIADHVRALTFAIADNAIISNEGRGYVLRRILRRAARYGSQLGLNEPFIYKIVQPLVEYMGDVYPEIKAQRARIELVIKSEETHFNSTLETGIVRFEDIVHDLELQNRKIISGAEVFKLYDTYGFPADLTEIMAKERGLLIDLDGFNCELEKQRERSKDFKFAKKSLINLINFREAVASKDDRIKSQLTEFVGYEYEAIDTAVLSWDSAGEHEIISLLKTPFYSEAGGQESDHGLIFNNFLKIEVTHVEKGQDGEIYHFGKLREGIDPGTRPLEVTAKIDHARRADIKRNHTATHILHKALRIVLGEHVYQSGSLVAPDRLRFDFSHFKAMTPDEILEVEKIVNDKIADDLPVRWEYKTLEEAKKLGAMALFGEKYGDTVRVVQAGDFTIELCGGTHVGHTADIGRFFILSESAIAAGIRRIEAITGREADKFFADQDQHIEMLKGLIDKPVKDFDNQVITQIKELQNSLHPRILERANLQNDLQSFLEKIKKLEKDKARLAEKEISRSASDIKPELELTTGDGPLIVYVIETSKPDELMTYFDSLKAKNQDKTVMVCSKKSGQLALGSPDYAFAIKIKDYLAEAVGAKGGGKPTIRGAMPAAKIFEAVAKLKEKFSA